MSTSANIIFKDETGEIALYKHWDGNPKAILKQLNKALKLAWKCPRMDIADFSAGVVATMKDSEGDIYIVPTGALDYFNDVEYTYLIEPDIEQGEWKVEVNELIIYLKGV